MTVETKPVVVGTVDTDQEQESHTVPVPPSPLRDRDEDPQWSSGSRGQGRSPGGVSDSVPFLPPTTSSTVTTRVGTPTTHSGHLEGLPSADPD